MAISVSNRLRPGLAQSVRTFALFLPLATALHAPLSAGSAETVCRSASIASASYIICEFDARSSAIEVYLNDAHGRPLSEFDRLDAEVRAKGRRLVFAMNAGMYHYDRSPVGLYIEQGREIAPANTRDAYGNFHLKPNGIFFAGDGAAGVVETEDFVKRGLKPRFATQSGPLLVIDGKLHPRLIPDSTTLYRRNGVGVDGDRIAFVLADTPVNFYQFALVFRDHLKMPNALYLDGSISRLFAPAIGRNDAGEAMGPIVAVTAPP